jgi:hypothetical protein
MAGIYWSGGHGGMFVVLALLSPSIIERLVWLEEQARTMHL